MTKLTPEAQAFHAKIDQESDEWPAELKSAAVYLRCELDIGRLKDWRAGGGPERLAKYLKHFQELYDAWEKYGKLA